MQGAEAKSTASRRRKRAGERRRRERRLTFERVAKGYNYFTLCPIDDGGDTRSVERSILAFLKFGEGDSRNFVVLVSLLPKPPFASSKVFIFSGRPGSLPMGALVL